MFVGAFESRVDRRRSFAVEHAATFLPDNGSAYSLYKRENEINIFLRGEIVLRDILKNLQDLSKKQGFKNFVE